MLEFRLQAAKALQQTRLFRLVRILELMFDLLHLGMHRLDFRDGIFGVFQQAGVLGEGVELLVDVPQPLAVRYAWSVNPVCNLFNSEGLPAWPFRTDDWPGVTCGKN